jgi:hypothetical protein
MNLEGLNLQVLLTVALLRFLQGLTIAIKEQVRGALVTFILITNCSV